MSARGELIKKQKMSHSASIRSLHQRPDSDFIPETWEDYFDSCFDILTSRGIFRTYYAGFDGCTTVICLHGGGYSSLTWSVFTQQILKQVKVKVIGIDLRGHGNSRVPRDEDLSMETLVEDMSECIEKLFYMFPNIPNIVLIGHSLGGAIATQLAAPSCRISNLIKALIVIDVVEGSALASLSHMNNILQSRPKGFATMKDAILWSATKAQTKDLVALRVSVPGQLKQINNNEPATAYVKEEQKMWHDLLTSQANMNNISLDGSGNSTNLNGRQRSAFQAVNSARPSLPRPMVSPAPLPPASQPNLETHELLKSSMDIENIDEPRRQSGNGRSVTDVAKPTLSLGQSHLPPASINMFRPISPAPSRTRMSLPGTPQRNSLTSQFAQPGSNVHRYTWRVNLHASATYWPGWFKGMSEKFLETSAKKLIILCGEDRLDTTLWTGHMQGKFQLILMKCGHQVQEDKPEELSEMVSKYLIRHNLAVGLNSHTSMFDTHSPW